MHGLVLEELDAALRDPDASRGTSRGAPQIAAEMADVLKAASGTPAGLELLRRYVPMLIATEPNTVLPVITVERQALGVDEVLQLLQGNNGLIVGYLEHVVLGKPNADPRHQAQLAQSYIAQVAEEQKGFESDPGRGVVTVLRRALLRFLEGANALDARALLPLVEQLGLNEEQVVLHCREQQHEEALRILVDVLDDLPRAEIYCRVVMARQSPAPFAAQGDSSQEAEVSLFCADPPPWAQGVVFGRRKEPPAGAVAEGDGLGSTGGPSPSGAVGSTSPRPLMQLLRVLLAAAEAADQRPAARRKVSAEYRDAALSLLTGYAGHRDLPPHEVIGMLPGSWSLEGLSGYLMKCARVCLHERRASMLEENLSSMAYLKTFTAWAQERMTKVTITGDRCCPVCNRRFVDKDSVGKAFVAYPNETCVHLQCKEDSLLMLELLLLTLMLFRRTIR